MINRGRKSRVLQYGYAEQIRKLRKGGFSYADIANLINEQNPGNKRINKDTISRYLKSVNRDSTDSKPIELIEILEDIFEDIYNELRKSSLNKREKNALLKFIKYRERKLKNKVVASTNLHSGYTDEFVRVRDLLIEYSKMLSEESRKRIVQFLK